MFWPDINTIIILSWANKVNFVCIMPQVQDLSLDLIAYTPVNYHCDMAVPRLHPKHTHTHTHTHTLTHTHPRTHARTNAHTHTPSHTHTIALLTVTSVFAINLI